jgi:pyruvate/2-oxoglutarate dehydrogenase complex dihydrolipoamide dehydrogenase (E3) component
MTADTTAGAQRITCDICVIGAGSGGLAIAAGAAQMGARVVLIERSKMGGDCLNTGCVPSKSIIAAAHAAHAGRSAGQFGVHFPPPVVDFRQVHDHIHGVIGAIAPHDSVERFESLGVRVLQESASFTGPDEVAAGTYRITARRYVVATGSRAAMPPVKGLAEVQPLTNESIFELTELPARLIVLGGGPIGLEMAQSFRRLGSTVTVLERFGILPRDEPEAAGIARAALRADGIELLENVEVSQVRGRTGQLEVDIVDGGQTRTIAGTHLLVAAGRSANSEGLGLETAGIKFGPRGVEVDAGLRSSNRKVYAVGDVAGGPQFTHIAGYHAGIVIRNALLSLPAKVDYAALPWVTYLDPEVAHVGLTEADARKKDGAVSILQESFKGNDRAQAERRTEGYIKIVLGRRGRIHGATIVAPHAGEMIGMWGLAISRKLPISAVAGMIAPYPTLSELSKRAAGSYYTPTLFGPRVKKIVSLVQKWLP